MAAHLRQAAQLLTTREALKVVEQREQVFSDTFDLAAVGIAHTACSGRLLRVNRRICEMLGYSREELLAMSFMDITHPDDMARNTELFLEMVNGKRDSYCMEKRFLRSDGEYVWMQLSVALRRSASGIIT